MKRKRPQEDDQGDEDHHPPSPDFSCQEMYAEVDPEAQNALSNQNNNNDHVLLAEQLQSLMEREIKFEFKKDENLEMAYWVHQARSRAIDWVLETRAMFGYRNGTAYLAITLFDRFFTLNTIPDNDDRDSVTSLFWIACFSLAAKMEERKSRIRPLTDYQVEDFNFRSSKIQEMEIKVFKALGWSLNLITPFMFLDYFISKWRQEEADIKDRIERLCVSVMTDINLMHHRPSSVAAAATLAAMDEELSRTGVWLKVQISPGLTHLDIDGVYFCYQLLKQHI